MKRPPPTGLAQSVLDRLRNRSRERNEDFNLLLVRFAGERFLHRLSKSEHRDRFVLKGATLFHLWTGRAHRPTRDLDLLGSGDQSIEGVAGVFRSVCGVDVAPDGVTFDASTLTAALIREDKRYGGIRVRLRATIGSAVVPLQIDVGFGDAITPAASPVIIKSMLDLSATTIPAYPPETVVAEKLEASVTLGIANSRMKDYYDLWVLSEERAFDLETLRDAIRATFERRRTPLPAEWPIGLSEEFAADRAKLVQWRAFLGEHGFTGRKIELAEAVARVRAFVGPALALVTAPGTKWSPGGPWGA